MSLPIRAAASGEAAAAARTAPPGSRPAPPGRGGGRLEATGLPQAARLIACALVIAGDRICEGLVDLLLPGDAPERARRRSAYEQRSVERVVATLGALKGPFAKLGQFAAVRLDVLPARATRAFATLRDRVPPLPFDRIRAVVESELGGALDVLFAEFDPNPLAAASIAQVHRARLHDGTAVAVKVQYPWLARSLPADLRLVRGLLRAWSLLGGRDRRDHARLLGEFAEGLRDELDFLREAQVAGEIARNLSGDPRVVVPEVFPSHSTRRVLTTGYLSGVPITDRDGLARMGARPRDVLEILARAYASQVFVHGLFHADPHPGNLFVLDAVDDAQGPRLLFVDFGLSRRLDPGLRREMRLAIHALIRRDPVGFLDGMDRMGMIAAGARPGVARAVEAMLERIAAEGGALGAGSGQVLSWKDEAKRLLQETEGLQLPNDLLLYAKTLSYVFSIGAELDPSVDMMRLQLPYLLRFLAEKDVNEDRRVEDPAGG
jgi:ubiquinone biosynthesis protein